MDPSSGPDGRGGTRVDQGVMRVISSVAVRKRRIPNWLVISVVSLSVFGVSGCVDTTPRGAETGLEMSVSPELAKEATDFGDWMLPVDGKVLLVKKEARPRSDVKFNLAVEMSPDGLAWMLEHSNYYAPFEKGLPVYPERIIAGPDLATSPSVQKAQDIFRSGEGDSMIRDVVVDERTADLRIVHIEFRGQ